MAKTLKKMKSLSERRDKYIRTAVLLCILGAGALLSGREVGIAVAALIFMAASTYFQRGKIWAAGASGETDVMDVLEDIPGEVFVINDLLITKDRGTAQIDHLLITEYGVFCIESKNYAGTVSGDDEICMHYTHRGSRRIRSPALQATEHARALRNLLSQRPEYWETQDQGLWVQPVVVFSNRVRLRYKSAEVPVMKLKDLKDYLTRSSRRQVIPLKYVYRLAVFVLSADLNE